MDVYGWGNVLSVRIRVFRPGQNKRPARNQTLPSEKVGHNSLECFGCVYYYCMCVCSGKRFVLSMSPSHARCVCEE